MKPFEKQKQFNYTVNVTPTEIKQEQKLNKITPRTVKWLLTDVWPTYERTSIDRTKSLVDFIRSDILKELIGLARRKFRGGVYLSAKDADMPKLLSDADIEFLLCVAVKPNSINEYQRAMIENVERMPPKLVWEFGVKDYDMQMTLKVEKILDDIKHFDEYFRRGAEHNASSCCPPMQWGKHGNIGVFNIAVECFGQYKDNFKAMISLDFLSTCRDMEKFVLKMRELNNEYTSLSEEHRIKDEKTRPSEKLETTISQLSAKDMQRRFVEGRAEKRTGEPGSEELGVQHRRYMEGRNSSGNDRERSPEIPKAEANLNQVDAIAKPPESAILTHSNQVMLVDVPRRSEVEARLAAMLREPLRPTPPQRGRSGPLMGPLTDGKLRPEGPFVCYRHAMNGTCDRGKECPFSHDDNLARRWVQSKAKMYAESPFLKHSEMQMSLIDEDADLGQMYRFTAGESSDEEEPHLGKFEAMPLVPSPPTKLSTKPSFNGSSPRPGRG
jgi:hypothetical protein